MNTQDFSRRSIPAWVRSAVFYQIFPDRFARGNAGDEAVALRTWGEAPNSGERQGGDLAGILQRFDYLCDLGINALYLCARGR